MFLSDQGQAFRVNLAIYEDLGVISPMASVLTTMLRYQEKQSRDEKNKNIWCLKEFFFQTKFCTLVQMFNFHETDLF